MLFNELYIAKREGLHAAPSCVNCPDVGDTGSARLSLMAVGFLAARTVISGSEKNSRVYLNICGECKCFCLRVGSYVCVFGNVKILCSGL